MISFRSRLWRNVGDGNLLNSFEWFCARGNVVYGVKNISAVVSRSASVADADDNIFQDDESLLVLERLARDLLRTYGPFAVFALITVSGIVIGLC